MYVYMFPSNGFLIKNIYIVMQYWSGEKYRWELMELRTDVVIIKVQKH